VQVYILNENFASEFLAPSNQGGQLTDWKINFEIFYATFLRIFNDDFNVFSQKYSELAVNTWIRIRLALCYSYFNKCANCLFLLPSPLVNVVKIALPWKDRGALVP
jgi:hypothetical protein